MIRIAREGRRIQEMKAFTKKMSWVRKTLEFWEVMKTESLP